MKKAIIRKDSYFDSVFLMALSKKLKEQPGVGDAVVAMGTAMNLELLGFQGYAAAELAGATPNDLIMAVDCADAPAVEAALAAAAELLARKKTGASASGSAFEPASLDAAVEELPGANLAVISLPGAYAAREARKALERGLHVMLFSDNVSLEDEIALKELGRSKGLLVMGPDCGTALINGYPICFANVVKRGPIGVVAASGTGLQEVTCLVDRYGSGVSQGIGTGGRDLKNERVGGITMLMGIAALAGDPATKVLVVISKPPAAEVAAKVLSALGDSGKPSVVHFIGLDPAKAGALPHNVRFASSLEDSAAQAVALAKGKPLSRAELGGDEAALAAIAEREAGRMSKAQKYLRGYYTGGTVADEALILLHRLTGKVHSNNQTDPAFILKDPKVSVGHTIVDLGDDVFTVGRPHPMIDPSTRTERVLAEAGDGSVAVLLVDVVLGYGSHEDPAGALVPSLLEARRAAEARGGYLPVVASVIGTPGDYQGFSGQVAKLEAAGCMVMPSNYRAVVLAAKILEKAAAK
ncbi:MAG: acyl-CoA synthetase FdrA [Treponema sp.]|nr:acyl-CoA synthetase FdrA [Treponema sp.]